MDAAAICDLKSWVLLWAISWPEWNEKMDEKSIHIGDAGAVNINAVSAAPASTSNFASASKMLLFH